MKKLFMSLAMFVLLAPNVMADECMEGDCEDGIGVGFTEEGKIYDGQWKEGIPHGKGKLQISKGKYLEGEFIKGTFKKEQ